MEAILANEIKMKIRICIEEIEEGKSIIRKLNTEIKLQTEEEVAEYGELEGDVIRFIENMSNKEECNNIEGRFKEEENIIDEATDNSDRTRVPEKGSSEVNEESKKSNKRRRMEENEEDEQNNRNKRKKLQNKMYNKLLEELLAPAIEEESNLEEIDETMNIGEELIKRLYRAKYKEGECLKEWYEYGKNFRRELNKRMERSKKENKIRNELYEDMEKYNIREIRRTDINNLTNRAEKVYHLFKEVGEEKLNNIETYGFHSIGKMSWEMIKGLIKEVKEGIGNIINEEEIMSGSVVIMEE